VNSEFLFEVMDIGAAGFETGIPHDVFLQGDIGEYAFDDHFRQRGLHAGDGGFAGLAPGDEEMEGVKVFF